MALWCWWALFVSTMSDCASEPGRAGGVIAGAGSDQFESQSMLNPSSRPLFNVLPILSLPPNATSETLRVDGECHFYRGPSAARLIVTTTSRKSTRRSSRLTSPSDKVPRVQTRSLCSLTPASNLPVPSISHRQQQFANVSPTVSFLSKIALGVSQRLGF